MIKSAATGCRLIVSYPEGKILHEDGDCNTRQSPASTFKLPLALMGYDSGILKDAHDPTLDYKPEYQGHSTQMKTIDPTIWERDSIVWYSQWLTRKLGMQQFQRYVDLFGYGNRDLSGTPGKNDGLTQAWLFSSLLISPQEQIEFLTRMLDRKLSLADSAYNMGLSIIPEFSAGAWTVRGKTGSGQINRDPNKPQGWFVGWAENGGHRIVFANLILPDHPVDAAGPISRDQFLAVLPGLLP